VRGTGTGGSFPLLSAEIGGRRRPVEAVVGLNPSPPGRTMAAMTGMEPARASDPIWTALFDRYVGRWLFAYIALSAVGLALLSLLTHGWVHLVLSLPGHLLVILVAGAIALLTRSPDRRGAAVLCLLGAVLATVPNLFGVGGHAFRGLLTCLLLVPVVVPAGRRALGARSAGAIVGLGAGPGGAIVGRGAPAAPPAQVAAARSELASRVPDAQVHRFERPILMLNPRSGSVLAVRDQLLEAAARYGVEVREAATPSELVALARQAVADRADVLGVAGGDGSLAAVATVAIDAGLPFVCVPAGTRNHFAHDLGLDRADPAAAIEAFVVGPERRVDVATAGGRLFLNNASIGIYAALVHEPSYREDRLGAVEPVLESVLERDALPVAASFRDGSDTLWEQVLVLFVSNNAYPLSDLGGRPRLDGGLLEVSALRRTEGQELGRAVESLLTGGNRAGDGWARWTATRLEVDSPSGRLQVGIDGEPVELETPIEFRIHAGALRVLVPASRSASGRPPRSWSRSPALGRRTRRIPATAEARIEQVSRLVRLGRLLGRIGEREFGGPRDEFGRPLPPVPPVPPVPPPSKDRDPRSGTGGGP
jgi:diacylglycerol kinase family enzyme